MGGSWDGRGSNVPWSMVEELVRGFLEQAKTTGGPGGFGAPTGAPWGAEPRPQRPPGGRGTLWPVPVEGGDAPWNPPRRGQGPGRGRAGRGDVRLAMLTLLREGPQHGYQLISQIEERSHGAWRPSPGSIYPALQALQDEGLIDDEKVDGKRVYSLTLEGAAYVADRGADLDGVFAAFTAPEPEQADMADLRTLLFGVGAAAIQVVTSGSPIQAERARTILSQARRDLYAVLAEQEKE